jgi:hypothetical protein
MRLIVQGKLTDCELLVAGQFARWVGDVTGVTDHIVAEARRKMQTKQDAAAKVQPSIRPPDGRVVGNLRAVDPSPLGPAPGRMPGRTRSRPPRRPGSTDRPRPGRQSQPGGRIHRLPRVSGPTLTLTRASTRRRCSRLRPTCSGQARRSTQTRRCSASHRQELTSSRRSWDFGGSQPSTATFTLQLTAAGLLTVTASSACRPLPETWPGRHAAAAPGPEGPIRPSSRLAGGRRAGRHGLRGLADHD